MTRSTTSGRLLRALAASGASAALLLALAPASTASGDAGAPGPELVLTGTVERFDVDDFGSPVQDDGRLTYVETAAGAVQVPSSQLAAVPDGATVRVGLVDSATADVTADGVEATDRAPGAPDVEAGADVSSLQVLAEPGDALTDTGTGTDVVEPAAATDVHSVLVVVAKPAGGTTSSVTASSIASTIDAGVNAYWSKVTGNRLGFAATAYGSVVSSSYSPCANGFADTFAFWNDIKAKVGFTEGAGKHLVVYFARLDACGGTAGLGTIGSGLSSGGLLWSNGYATVGVLGHELGHNVSLGHSQTLSCNVSGVRVMDAAPTQCTKQSYRDTNDIMGVSWQNQGYLNASHLRFLGVLPAGAETAPTGNGQVALAPLASASGTRVLTLVDGGTRYVVEYRAPTGQDAWMSGLAGWGSAGVTVRREFDASATSYSARESYLLDGDPTTADASFGALYPTLPQGVWRNLGSGYVGIRVVSTSASGAVIDYRNGPASDDDRYVAPAMPVLSAPAASLRTGAVSAGTSSVVAPTTWRWKVTVGSDATWRTASGSSTATPTTRTISYRASAAASDGTVVSVTGKAAVLYRAETSSTWHWSTGWSTVSSSTAVGRKVKVTSKKGASVYATVTGRSLAVLLQRGPRNGSAAVYVDGTRVATVRMTSSTTGTKAAVVRTFSTTGTHRVKVVNLTGGTSGKVGFEGVVAVS